MIYILLSTYNGSKYLNEFLDSLVLQSMNDWLLLARDDGSSDHTREILSTFALSNPSRVELICETDNLGAMGGFSRLLEYATSRGGCNYIMFADQDDVWKSDKLSKTLAEMKRLEDSYGADMPLLVHTDLTVVDEALNVLDKSFWHYQHLLPQKKSISKLLMQNNITGCTVMINIKLAQLSMPISERSIMHDWWIGLAASAFGKISYLDEATMLYRQHGANDTGAKHFSYLEVIKKAFSLFVKKDIYTAHLDKNIAQAKAFLRQYEDKLGESDKRMLTDFCNIKEYSFWKKRYILFRYSLFKQGIIRNIGLLLRV